MADDRRRPAPRTLAAVVGLAAAAIALGGCEKLELKRRELPGFSLHLPTFVKVPADLSYRAGELEGQKGFNAIYVSWEVGAIMTADEMPAALRISMEHFAKGERVEIGEASRTMIGGQPATSIEGKSGSVRIAYAQVTCGKRGITLSIVASSSYAMIRDRVYATFQCTPDPEEEAALGDLIPIGADDPSVLAGWHYLDDDREVFSITDGQRVAIFTEMSARDAGAAKELRALIPKFFEASGASFEPAAGGEETRTLSGGERRTFERGEFVADDNRSPAVTTLWTCGDGARMVMGLVISPDADTLPAAVDWLARLRCSQPGDTTKFDRPAAGP
ncbi:MAG TPA: hypothetical protein VM261_34460 [Kofleriaceae bacterium]|nr:hypothetical protein [Kofleriaceae bacterium]